MNKKIMQTTETELNNMRDRLEGLRAETIRIQEEKQELESDIAVVSEFLARFGTGTGNGAGEAKPRPVIKRTYGLTDETMGYLREMYPMSVTLEEIKENLKQSGMLKDGTNLHSLVANMLRRGKATRHKENGVVRYMLKVVGSSLDKVKP